MLGFFIALTVGFFVLACFFSFVFFLILHGLKKAIYIPQVGIIIVFHEYGYNETTKINKIIVRIDNSEVDSRSVIFIPGLLACTQAASSEFPEIISISGAKATNISGPIVLKRDKIITL